VSTLLRDTDNEGVSFIEVVRDPIGGFKKRDLYKGGAVASWYRYDYPVELYIRLVEMTNVVENVTREQVFVELI